MRYNLGYMDKYPIEAAGSVIENNPMFKIYMKSPVDAARLEGALYKAMETYPLFATRVEFDGEYYLATNTRPIKLIHAGEEDRPLNFGKDTNDYPWQCCYRDNVITFEWLHGVTDGLGAMNFFSQVLIRYCQPELPASVPVEPLPLGLGLEPFYDPKEKGENFHTDPPGFSFKDFPAIKNRGYTTDCHHLRASTAEIAACARNLGSSFAPVIALLFSKALRRRLPENIKNRNVACNVVMNLRQPLEYETMHNCVEYKRITYQDKYDAMSLKDAAAEYKHILDNGRLKANVVKMVTDRVRLFRVLHAIRVKKILNSIVSLTGLLLKDKDCNFVLTYPGQITFPKSVLDEVEDVQLKLWHDFGECIIACLDYNGVFNVNICENYADKGVVDEFIRISEEVGIHWENVSCAEFTQAHFVES